MIVDSSEMEDFYSSLRRAGYAKDEFEVSEKEDAFPNSGVGPLTGA